METDQLIINLLIVVFGTLSLRQSSERVEPEETDLRRKRRLDAGLPERDSYQHWHNEQTPNINNTCANSKHRINNGKNAGRRRRAKRRPA